MSKLRDQMMRDLELKGYALDTQRVYLGSVENFSLFFTVLLTSLARRRLRSICTI